MELSTLGSRVGVAAKALALGDKAVAVLGMAQGG